MKTENGGSSYRFPLLCIMVLPLLIAVPLVSAQDVRLPPSLTKGAPAHMYYKERASVTLYCEGVGYPGVVYEWVKNGIPLNVNTSNIQMRPGVGTIDISSCLSTDEGFYQCILSNSYGKTMSNTTFLQMASLASFPPISGSTPYLVDLNGHVCLLCQPPLASTPPADIYWKYNFTGNTGKPIGVVENSRIQTDPFTGSLCLTNVEASDGTADRGKVYICNVENTVLQTINQGSYSALTTSSNSMGSYGPLLTFRTSATVIGLEGETMVLRCFFSGSPVPSITWKKNGQSVPQNRWTITHAGTGLTRTSGMLIQDDAGGYSCEASNGIGASVVHSMQLTVEARPLFISEEDRPHDINATEADDVIVSCNPRAIPDVTVRWFKNQAEFTAASLPPKMNLSADLKTLTITDLCKDCYEGSAGDLMSIQCNASNEHGYSYAQGYVNVLVATVMISVGGQRPWIAYQTEVFDCEATSDDSTPLTHRWTYNGFTILETESIYVAVNGSLVIVMQNDTDGGESRQGEYRCVASNGHSQAEVVYILEALTAKLTITAKSTLYEIFVDGSPVPRCHCNGASFPEEIELQPDSQLIAVTAIDTTGTCAGILASTTNDSLVTNPTWKCTTDPPPHWYTLGFDDTAWSDAYAIGPNHNVTWPADCNNALQGIDLISANAFWIWTPSILETPFYDYTIHCRAYLLTCDKPSICLNGGRCNSNRTTLCTCLPGYTGVFCESEFKRTMNITAKSVIYELFVDEIRQNLTHNDDWKTVDGLQLSPHSRLVAILAADSSETCAGILASVTDDYLVTDATWKCVVGPPPNWHRFDFDDSAWPSAYVIGPNGNVTWPDECKVLTEVPTVSQNANWIWTPTIAGAPVYDHAVYCRAYLPFCETAQPCQNGGICNRNNATLCSCPGGFTGVYCESLL